MNNAGYGYALYYPYIHLQDEKWLKMATLYYEGLRRIVPKDYKTNDTDIVKVLNDEFRFIRDLRPDYEPEQIADDFLQFAHEELSDKDERKDILKKIRKRLPRKSGFRIHVGKMGKALRRGLPRLGLAKRIRTLSQPGPWYDFEPVTGALYMTCLANRMAERRALHVVTDNPIYQPLIRGIQLDRWGGRPDKAHALASLAIETAVPENIESVPIERIVEFRRRHNDERHRFYEGVRALAKDIPTIDEPDAFRDCLNYHKKTIDEAVKDLRLSLTSVGIGCATALFGLSVPSWASNLAQKQGGLGILMAAGGIVCAAAGVVIKEGVNYYKSRRSSPWSYILSLRRGINSESLIRSLLRGTILL